MKSARLCMYMSEQDGWNGKDMEFVSRAQLGRVEAMLSPLVGDLPTL